MPAPIDISSAAELDRILSTAGAKLTVIDFHATWCGPCHAIGPVFARLAQAHPGNFLRVDTDQLPDVAKRYSVTAMPTFVFIKHGSVVDTLKGADAAGLQRLIKQHATATTFSGTGHTLAGSSSTSSASSGRGVPKVPSSNFSSWLRSEHALPIFLLGVYVLYVINS